MNIEPIVTPVGATPSYFEKNKKMVILLVVMLLVFAGLITYIFISQRPVENKAETGMVNPDIEDEVITKPVVSAPVIDDTEPTQTPNNKSLTFKIESNQFSVDYVPEITVSVPSDTISTVLNAEHIFPSVAVSNANFKLTFGIHYEGAGMDKYKENFVSLGEVPGIVGTVYRVEDVETGTIGYTTSTSVVGGDCISEVRESFTTPCGTIYIGGNDMRGFSVYCEASTTLGLGLCDTAIRSLQVVNKEK